MARKINKKSLIIIASVMLVAAIGLGVVYAFKGSILNPPSRILRKAKEFEDKGQLFEAAKHYAWAAQKLKSPYYYTMAGDLFNKITYDDDENVRLTLQCWNMAISTDPGYMPALERTLAISQEYLELQGANPDPGTIEEVKQLAEKVLKVQPDNTKARLAAPSAVVRGWLYGIETDPKAVDESIAQLREALARDPKNMEVATLIARSLQKQSRLARQQGNSVEADLREDESVKFLDDLIQAHPDDASLHYRLAQLVVTYYAVDSESERNKKYFERFKQELLRAKDLTKPDNFEFLDIMNSAGRFLAQDGKAAEAEKVFRDMLQNKPNDPTIRLLVGEYMGSMPKLRDEGIALLEAPFQADDESKVGLRGTNLRALQMRMALSAAMFKLDKFTATTDPEERKKIINEVQATYDKAVGKYKDQPMTLRVLGKLQLFTNKPVEATQTLQRALNGMSKDDPNIFELRYLLANANAQTQQFGEAQKQLEEVVARVPSYLPAKIQLANVLLKKQDKEAARKLVDEIVKALPDDPQVARLFIATRDMTKEKEEALRAYKKILETTRDQRILKAAIAAAVMKDADDSIRLIELVLKDDPKDIEARLGKMGWIENMKNDKPGALAYVEQSIKELGDDPRLLMERARLKGEPMPKNLPVVPAAIRDSLKPAEREFAAAMEALNARDEKAFAEHLAAAEKADPKSEVVLDRAFVYQLTKRDWPKAEDYARRLGDLNADKAGGNVYRWRLMMAQNDLVRAAEQAATLTRDYGEFAQSYVCLGQTLLSQEKYADAITQFSIAQQKQPNNPDIYLGLIHCCDKLARAEEMKKWIDEASRITKAPVFSELQRQWEQRYGDPEATVASREKALKDNPDAPGAWRQLGTAYTLAGFNRRTKKNDEAGAKQFFEKARDTYVKALEKFPDDDTLAVPCINVFTLLGDIPGAEKVLDTFAARPAWKDKPQIYSLRFDFNMQVNKPDKAEAAAREGLTKFDDENIRSRLLDLLARQKRTDDALKVLGDSQEPQRLRQRIDILILGERFDDAAKVLEPLRVKDPASTDLLGLDAYIKFKQGKIDESLAGFNEVLKRDPGNRIALYHRGLLNAGANKLTEALQDINRLKELEPNNIEVRYLAAECAKRSRDFDGMCRELAEIVQKDPAQKVARLRLISAYLSTDPPRYIDAERIAREAHNVASLATDPDIFSAEARIQQQKQDYRKALAIVSLGIKNNPGKANLVEQMFEILRKGKMYDLLLQQVAVLPKEMQALWWVRANKAVAIARTGDRAAGLAEFDAALTQTISDKVFGASEGVVSLIAEELGPEAALKQIEPHTSSDVQWKLMAVKLYQQKGDNVTARKLVEQVLADPKLTPDMRMQALGYAGTVYVLPPEPNYERSRDLFLELLKARPNDLQVMNNLACNPKVELSQALDYSQRAYDLMRRSNISNAYIMDTHGWNLIQAGKTVEGLSVLSDAWGEEQFPDLAYHMGEGYLRLSGSETERQQALLEADKYLKIASDLFKKNVETGKVDDLELQKKIMDAQSRVTAEQSNKK